MTQLCSDFVVVDIVGFQRRALFSTSVASKLMEYWLVVLTCFNHLEKYESVGMVIPNGLSNSITIVLISNNMSNSIQWPIQILTGAKRRERMGCWGLLGWLLLVIMDHSRKFPTFSTSKNSIQIWNMTVCLVSFDLTSYPLVNVYIAMERSTIL